MDRKEKIKKLIKQKYTYKEIGKKFNISKQRVHSILTGYVSPSNLPPTVEELKNWTKRKREAFPKEFEQFLNRNKIPVEELKNWTKRKRFFLSLPENVRAESGGRNFIRDLVRERDSNTCQNCKKKWKKGERKLDVHHLDEDMQGKTRMNGVIKYDKENFHKLITFCHKCHFNWHKEKGHTKKWNKN